MRIQSRRTDAFPTTWELPVGILVTWLLASFLALPLGQGLAFLLIRHYFVWPGPELGVSLLGLLSGSPGRGLPAELQRDLPPAALVYASAAVVELALAALALGSLLLWWRAVGPFAQFGLAAKHEVAAVVGPGALRRRRRTIRPDLCSRRRP